MAMKELSPAEMCRIFGISKGTLFRWERERPLPPVERDGAGERRYTRVHVEAIARVELKRITPLYDRASQPGNLSQLEALHRKIAYYKFLLGDVYGLHELLEPASLLAKPGELADLGWLLLTMYEPNEPFFAEALDGLAQAARKLSKQVERENQ